jgi:hypothetical protein
MNTANNTAAKILPHVAAAAKVFVDALVEAEGVWGAIDELQGETSWHKFAAMHLPAHSRNDKACKAMVVRAALSYVDTLAEAAAE